MKTVFKENTRFKALLLSLLLSAIGFGLYKGVIDNYLAEVVGMGELDRGVAEFFRELPGLLLIFILAIFYRFSAEKMYKTGMVIMTVGMLIQAFVAPVKALVIAAIFFYSLGEHIQLGMKNTLSLEYSRAGRGGLRALPGVGGLFRPDQELDDIVLHGVALLPSQPNSRCPIRAHTDCIL